MGKGHDQTIDWWAFGILMYLLLTGDYPFDDEDPQQIYH